MRKIKEKFIQSIQQLYGKLKDQSKDYGELKRTIEKISKDMIWVDPMWGTLVSRELKKMFEEDIYGLQVDIKKRDPEMAQSPENGGEKMDNIKKIREFAKEITKECENRNYTVAEAELLVNVLKDEISQCNEAQEDKAFKALAEG